MLSAAKQLSEVQQRKVAALVGAVVADAAVVPLEWIYDVEKLKGIVGDKDPVFWPESKCPFFKVPTGRNSCYGDIVGVSLKSLVDKKGLDLVDFHTKLYAHYGPGTDYERATQEAAQKVKPVNGPWPNGAVKYFLKTYAANKEAVIGDPNIMDMDAVFFAIPVMVLYAGKPDLQEQVERTVRILQTNESVVAHSAFVAKMLETYILTGGNGVDEALKSAGGHITEEVKAVTAALDTPHGQVVQGFGLACSMPGSFKGALHAIYNATDYSSVVRRCVVGGDVCCRSLLAGSSVAAQKGLDAIPVEIGRAHV